MLTIADSSCDVRENVQAGDSTVYLSASVIGDDNALASNFVRFYSVLYALDALEHKRPAAGYSIPLRVLKHELYGAHDYETRSRAPTCSINH